MPCNKSSGGASLPDFEDALAPATPVNAGLNPPAAPRTSVRTNKRKAQDVESSENEDIPAELYYRAGAASVKPSEHSTWCHRLIEGGVPPPPEP